MGVRDYQPCWQGAGTAIVVQNQIRKVTLMSKGDEGANLVHLISITRTKKIMQITSTDRQNFQSMQSTITELALNAFWQITA